MRRGRLNSSGDLQKWKTNARWIKSQISHCSYSVLSYSWSEKGAAVTNCLSVDFFLWFWGIFLVLTWLLPVVHVFSAFLQSVLHSHLFFLLFRLSCSHIFGPSPRILPVLTPSLVGQTFMFSALSSHALCDSCFLCFVGQRHQSFMLHPVSFCFVSCYSSFLI